MNIVTDRVTTAPTAFNPISITTVCRKGLFGSIREYENAHIVLWIGKDSAWCCGWHIAGMAMIIPTLAVAIDIARRSRRDKAEFSHNLAVCMWICANAVWMTGEFFFDDGWRPGARVFFALGVLALAWHYVPLLWRRSTRGVFGEAGRLYEGGGS